MMTTTTTDDGHLWVVQVRAAYNPQRQIVNNNFNVLKAFIHHWRAAVPLPLPGLLSLLSATPARAPSGAPDARAKRKSALYSHEAACCR